MSHVTHPNWNSQLDVQNVDFWLVDKMALAGISGHLVLYILELRNESSDSTDYWAAKGG